MNTTSPQQIDTWLSSRSEHQRLEFKEAKDQFDNKKLNRYCVTIANQGDATSHLGWMAYKKRRLTTAMQSIILGPFEVTGVLLHCP